MTSTVLINIKLQSFENRVTKGIVTRDSKTCTRVHQNHCMQTHPHTHTRLANIAASDSLENTQTTSIVTRDSKTCRNEPLMDHAMHAHRHTHTHATGRNSCWFVSVLESRVAMLFVTVFSSSRQDATLIYALTPATM